MTSPTEVPGPKPMPVIGSAYTIDTSNLVLSAERMAKEYGKFYKHEIPGRPTLYIISSAHVVDQITDESRFYKVVHPAISNVRPFAGNGLFTAEDDDEEWGQAHRILMPGFSPLALKGMYEGMADVAEQLILKWTRTRPDDTIAVTDDFTRLTLDTIALCSFSYRFNSFYSEDLHPFVHSMVGALYESGRRAHAIDLQKKMMFISNRKWKGYVDYMHQVVDELIEDRKANPHSDDEWDLLDVMLHAEDPETGERLSDRNMRYQLVSFLVAGHETTSGFLSFATYLLLKNPEILERARAEVDEALDGRFPEVDDLPKLRYIDQIFREVLRLYPTAPGFAVTPYETTTIDTEVGEVEVKNGETLFVLIGAMHRDPAVWEDPEKFNPERFSPENAVKVPQNAWKPFGNGKRSCIGRAFALQESMIVMSLMLQHLNFEFADPTYELDIKETLTIKPKDFHIHVYPREGKEFRGRGNTAKQGGIDTGMSKSDQEINSEGPAYGQQLRVFLGSKAGTSRNFAEKIAAQGRSYGFDVLVDDLDNAIDNLSTQTPNIIVTSSYEGLPPDNAKKFYAWLLGETDAGRPDLTKVDFAVFGLGNKQWAKTFQKVPTTVDAALEEAGGNRFMNFGSGDVTEDFHEKFYAWQADLWPEIAKITETDLPDFRPETLLNVEIIDDGRTRHLRHDNETPLLNATVVSNDLLSNHDELDIEEKRAVRVQLPEGVTYTIGDYLEVLPRNSQHQIDRVLNRFDISGDQRVWLTGNAQSLPLNSAVAVETIVRDYVELSQPATRSDLQQLADACPCPPEAQEIRELATEPHFSQEVLVQRLSVLDVLEKYQSIDIQFTELLKMLPPMSPRRYSISSSPLAGEKEALLTFSVIDRPAFSGHGRFEGVCSNYLASTAPGTQLAVAVDAGPEHFVPTEDLSTPMILIGAGSGIAPLRAFLEHVEKQAEAEGTTPAKSLLFFGCHGRDEDLLFSEDIARWEEQGIVSLRPAFSRHEDQSVVNSSEKVRYVQDRLRHDAADVDAAIREGARILVCGDGDKLRYSVPETIIDILQQQRGISKGEAEQIFQDMESKDHTYVSDLFD